MRSSHLLTQRVKQLYEGRSGGPSLMGKPRDAGCRMKDVMIPKQALNDGPAMQWFVWMGPAPCDEGNEDRR
jgi:hypothetical protein